RDVSQLKDSLRMLEQSFTAQAFGDPSKISPAALTVAQQTQEVSKRLAVAAIRPATMSALLRRLCDVPADLDFDSARQIGFALRVIATELPAGGGQERPLREALRDLDRLLVLRPEKETQRVNIVCEALAELASSQNLRIRGDQFRDFLK